MAMDEIVIYGASDDLIEVESTRFGAEEFNIMLDYPEQSVLLAVSDGSLLRVRYDEDGVWRFDFVVIGSASVTKEYGQDDKRHSDRITLTGDDLRWVVLGSQIAR
jgi:hypothetical protein